jgi:hypothetical protein
VKGVGEAAVLSIIAEQNQTVNLNHVFDLIEE